MINLSVGILDNSPRGSLRSFNVSSPVLEMVVEMEKGFRFNDFDSVQIWLRHNDRVETMAYE